MNIVFCSGTGASGMDSWLREWLAALAQALPEANIFSWDETGAPDDADFAVVWSPPAELFQRYGGLRAVFNLGAGVDALLALDNLPEDLAIVRMEDAGMADQMAEYVLYFLAQQSRGFAAYGRQKDQRLWQRLPYADRHAWPVGVMGAGAIGARVAGACAGLGYPTAVWSRSLHNFADIESFAGQSQLQNFLRRTRVLVNVLPLTEYTRGILSRELFRHLLPGALLINIARGAHLAEDDLIPALDAGLLDFAALDVFASEPLAPEHPFWSDARISITPHVAGISLVEQTVAQIAGKIRSLIEGEPISGVVDRLRQY